MPNKWPRSQSAERRDLTQEYNSAVVVILAFWSGNLGALLGRTWSQPARLLVTCHLAIDTFFPVGATRLLGKHSDNETDPRALAHAFESSTPTSNRSAARGFRTEGQPKYHLGSCWRSAPARAIIARLLNKSSLDAEGVIWGQRSPPDISAMGSIELFQDCGAAIGVERTTCGYESALIPTELRRLEAWIGGRFGAHAKTNFSKAVVPPSSCGILGANPAVLSHVAAR